VRFDSKSGPEFSTCIDVSIVISSRSKTSSCRLAANSLAAIAGSSREDAYRYRESYGVQIMTTLRSLAMNDLRLDGYWSITEGLAALAHDIRGLLALLGWREPSQALSSA
jgi:hypothetical protein